MCISAALFAVGHFSLKWDFVSRAHWLALSPGSKTHLGVLWTERERYCAWWSRLGSDSLVLPPPPASSHYTANTHTGSVALLVPWIKPDFYLVSWEPANSCCTQQYGSADCFAMHLRLFGSQPILVQYESRFGLGNVRFCFALTGNHKKVITPASICACFQSSPHVHTYGRNTHQNSNSSCRFSSLEFAVYCYSSRLRLLDSSDTYPISLDLFWGYFVFSLLVAGLAWLHEPLAQRCAGNP